MALVLKTGKIFTDPNTGGTYNEAYLKIGKITYDRDQRIIEFILLTYVSSADRQLKKQPIFVDRHATTGDKFTTHFSPSVLDNTDNIVAAIYQYLLQLRDTEGVLLYSDWESDVI